MGGTTTSLRTKIVDAARAELKKQSDPPGPQGPISQDPAKRFQEGATEVRGGWERLRDIFSDTVQNFNQAGDPSFKAALGGLPLGKSWCGIFGTHVLHQAGVNAQWDLNTGKMAGAGIKLLKVFEREDTSTIVPGNRTAENLYLEPGDVVSIESKDNHHCVIVSIDIARKTLETIEGNTLYQEIRAGSRKTSVVTAVYKVVGETKYPASLFEPTTPLAGTVAAALEGNWKVTIGGESWVYKFLKHRTIEYGRNANAKQGGGQWFPAGKGFLKIAWQASGSVELWDISNGLARTGQKGSWFLGASAPVAVTADKI